MLDRFVRATIGECATHLHDAGNRHESLELLSRLALASETKDDSGLFGWQGIVRQGVNRTRCKLPPCLKYTQVYRP